MDAQPGVIGTSIVAGDGHLVNGGLPLPVGSTLRIEDGRETLVCVRRGCVWMTQEREERDVILESGQSFRISRDGRTLITALDGSVIALGCAHGKLLPRCIELVLPGAARPVVVYERGRGVRGLLAAATTRLAEIWLGLYTSPPRRMNGIV